MGFSDMWTNSSIVEACFTWISNTHTFPAPWVHLQVKMLCFCVGLALWLEGVIDVSSKHKGVDFKCLCVCLKDL